jgi:hypothetical protein
MSRAVARAAAGRDRAEREFAWPVVARQHLAFFDALLQRPFAAASSDPLGV